MCGIAGFSAIKQPTIHVEAILGSLDHRGPDDRGTWTDGLVSLFHTRLSIIDLSTAARQPFGDATGRYVLIYNGEIYNYRELRETIPYNWTTSSDTEVLLAALIRHGEKALSMLEGMFAFAFFDKETREMIIARDRLGKKPLYYTADENALSFASEVRTLLKINGKPGVISRQNLSNWLFLQSIPGEETLVNSVKRVLPGEYLKVKDNRITERKRFWDPSDCIAGNEFEGKPTKDTLKTLVTEAISKRLESDVPLACFLSGGVDSSIITAVASQQVSGKLATFHLAFREEGYSEHSMARLVAERYKTDHHECFLESNELLDALPDALSACDHPSGDGLNTYVLSKKVQEFGFKATLSGLGADEWFVGYSYFRDFEKWRKLSFLSPLLNAVNPLPFRARKVREIMNGTRAQQRGREDARRHLPEGRNRVHSDCSASSGIRGPSNTNSDFRP
ncbi:MAG: asparagine synthase (glutamine-hydrolyzing) [Bacteroidota bacterium]